MYTHKLYFVQAECKMRDLQTHLQHYNKLQGLIKHNLYHQTREYYVFMYTRKTLLI